MDCNAQFSEIFCKNVFTQLMSQQEQSKIISTYSQTAFCSSCQKSLSSQCEVVVNYVSLPLEDLLHSRISFKDWPNFILSQNFSLTLQCSQCEQQCDSISSSSVLSDIIFVEFSPGFMSFTGFPENITMLGIRYNLCVMVRHLGSHFTCVVLENDWLYIDDLQEGCEVFRTLQQLQDRFFSGWFFGVAI